MAIADPIEALIAANPVAVEFSVPVLRKVTVGYDPDLPDYVPPSKLEFGRVFGALSHADAFGLSMGATATLYMRVGDVPSNAKTETTAVTVAGDTYMVAHLKKRFRRGVQNGWTLQLRQ